MPWIHFHSGNKGFVKACCVANINYGNINEQSLEEIWSGERINKLRERFKAGLSDKRCFGCLNREKAGNKSIRQETFEKYGHLNFEAIDSPIYFDIRFSNICNFKCRTCWHGASSKWFDDAKKLGRNAGEKAIIENIDDFDAFIGKTGPALLQAKEIYFAGGEPLVTEEHYRLLDFLQENDATAIHLRYNTNFSKLRFKDWDAIEIWRSFESIEIMASVDASGEEGAYIRNGFDWELFKTNREKLRVLPNVGFKVAPTISVYNIDTLPNLYLELVNGQIIEADDFYLNILERPYHFNVKILSEERKKDVCEIYENFLRRDEIPEKIRDAFRSVRSFMNEENLHQKYWPKFEVEDSTINQLWEPTT